MNPACHRRLLTSAAACVLVCIPHFATGQQAKGLKKDSPKRAAEDDAPRAAVAPKAAPKAIEGPAVISAALLSAYTRSWTTAAAILQFWCRVAPETTAELTKLLEPEFKKLADRVASQNGQLSSLQGVGLRDELRDVILPIAKKRLSPDQFQKYSADIAARKQFIKDSAIDAMVAKLHSSIALQPEQIKVVRERLDTGYRDVRDQFLMRAAGPEFGAAVRELIADALTETQLAALDALSNPQLLQVLAGLPGVVDESCKQRVDHFRKALRAVLDAHIEGLTRMCELEAAPVRKLNIFSRAIEEDICQERVEFREALEKVGGPRPPRPDPVQIEYATATSADLLNRNERWNTFLLKTADDNGREQLKALVKEIEEAKKTAIAASISIGLGQQIGLAGDQIKQLSDVFRETISSVPRMSHVSPELIRAIVGIPDEKIQPILGEANMDMWREQMQEARQALQQMEAQAQQAPRP
jgi:hypothetical protein